ncbi:DUF4135 domain-containing protein [Clostridium sp. CTA-5]
MLSKSDPCDEIKEIINSILINRYSASVTTVIINNLFRNISDIVFNEEEFFKDILAHFNKYKIEKNKIEKYLNLIIKTMNLTKKKFPQLEKEKLKKKGSKIKRIKVLLDNEISILTFTDGSKILFLDESILKKHSLFNEIICYLNKKIAKENYLDVKKIVHCKKYGFLGASAFVNDKDLAKYYFKSGELLAVLYLLCCKDTKKLFSLTNPIIQNKFSASNVANHILEVSVYTIDFLPFNKRYLNHYDIEAIKSGFEYMYNVMVSNKIDFIFFIKDIFINDIKYLGNVLTKLNILNKEDLKMQLYLIDVRFSENEFYRDQIIFSDDENTGIIDRKKFIRLADSLGDYLIKKSIIGYNNENISRTWINSILYGLGKKTCNAYNINNGIALFFVYLGELTKKKYFINVALEIMQESIDSIDNMGEYSKFLFYELFTLSEIYSITKSKTIKSTINKGIKIIKESKKEHISASNMVVILAIYNNIECNKIQELILDLANLLYKNIKFDDQCEETLAFLINFMSITKDKEIKNTIEKLLDFQRKKSLDKNYFKMLLNRIRLKELEYDDNLINEEINEGLNYIINNGFDDNSLFIDEIVNIEILEYAAEVLNNKELKNRCVNTFNDMVNKIIEPAIYDEIHYGSKPISLTKGITGYGYSLIRKCSNINIDLIFIYKSWKSIT